MADFLSPGLKVSQVRKGPVVFQGIATAIGGYCVYTAEGPVGKAIKVTSPQNGAEIFGGRITSPGNGRLTDTLIDHFDEGGTSCYVTRYIGAGYATASRNLSTVGGATAGSITSSASSFPVQLAVGDTFTASIDAGAGATATVAATRALVTGASATYAAVAPGTTMVVSGFGLTGNQTITFDGSENSQAAYHAQINAQLRGGSAVNQGGETRLQTDQFGSGASGAIVSLGAGLGAALGLAAGALTNAGPNNVANVDAVTAAELAAMFEASGFGGTSTSTANANNSVTLASDTTGAASSVQFTGGTGVAKIAGFDLVLHSGTTLTPVQTVQLDNAVGLDLSPGTAGNLKSTKAEKVDTIVTKVAATAAGSTSTLSVASSSRLRIGDQISITKGGDTQRGFIQLINGNVLTLTAAITVPGGGYDGSEDVVNETWTLTVYDSTGAILTPSPYRNLRMSPLAGSSYFVNAISAAALTKVKATDLSAVVSHKDARPATDSAAVAYTGGLDGAAPTASDVTSVISAFNRASDVSFISVPGGNTDFTGVDGVAILTALRTYAELRQDIMAIFATPQGTAAGTAAATYVTTTANIASQYCAVYWNWPMRLDSTTGVLTAFPPEPHVQGIIARTHRTRNFGKAPAGIVDGVLLNVQSLESPDILEGSAEMDIMGPAHINAILKFEGEGICIWGCDTLDVTGEFDQVNVQIVFNVNKRLIKKQCRWTVFEPNNTSTRNSVIRQLTSLFREQRKAGILQGESDEEAFFIQCDEHNNPASVIAAGKLVVRVGLAVTKAAKFVDISLELDTRAIDAELALQQSV